MIRRLGIFLFSIGLIIAQVTFGPGIPFRAPATGGRILTADFYGDVKPDIVGDTFSRSEAGARALRDRLIP